MPDFRQSADSWVARALCGICSRPIGVAAYTLLRPRGVAHDTCLLEERHGKPIGSLAEPERRQDQTRQEPS